MTAPTVHHPIFARLFHRSSRLMESELGPHRDELLAGVAGRVLEVGAGDGANFSHYPPTVSEVVAVEPESYLRMHAARAAATAPVPITVRDAVAERLPLDDASVDVAVVSLVLCTVADLRRSVDEIARVLVPGGELRFFEHVRSGRPHKARIQRAIDRPRLWPRVGGGCHCGRDTIGALRSAGFEIEQCRSFNIGAPCMHTNPYELGRARAPQRPPSPHSR